MKPNQRKFTLTTDGREVYRQTSLKVLCTEESVLAIVTPIVDLAAYLYAIRGVSEMPDSRSLSAAVLNSKTRLAVLLAHRLGRPVEPKNLSLPTAEIILNGGYIKVKFYEKIAATKQERAKRYSWSLTLVSEDQTPLALKIAGAIQHKQPGLSRHQAIEQAMLELGL